MLILTYKKQNSFNIYMSYSSSSELKISDLASSEVNEPIIPSLEIHKFNYETWLKNQYYQARDELDNIKFEIDSAKNTKYDLIFHLRQELNEELFDFQVKMKELKKKHKKKIQFYTDNRINVNDKMETAQESNAKLNERVQQTYKEIEELQSKIKGIKSIHEEKIEKMRSAINDLDIKISTCKANELRLLKENQQLAIEFNSLSGLLEIEKSNNQVIKSALQNTHSGFERLNREVDEINLYYS